MRFVCLPYCKHERPQSVPNTKPHVYVGRGGWLLWEHGRDSYRLMVETTRIDRDRLIQSLLPIAYSET